MIKYWQVIAVEALNEEQLVLANAASLRVLQLNPQHAPSHVVRAEILIELQRPDLAMIHLLLAIELGSADKAIPTSSSIRMRSRSGGRRNGTGRSSI